MSELVFIIRSVDKTPLVGVEMKEYLKKIDQVIENGYYKDNWDSLMNFELPVWFKNAKFGIFIHWGLYSVPANSNEWY